VFDNGHLGLVRQQQQLFYERRFCASRFVRPTDFAAVARAFGIRAERIDLQAGEAPRLDQLLSLRGPQLLHLPLPAAELVLPMVPPGAGNHEMLIAEPV